MTDLADRVSPDAKTILLVDDEFDIVTVYTMLFAYHGYRTVGASSGREALAAIEREAPDLIVSDYMMPMMNGLDLCWAVRRDPALREIPFILLSAALPENAGELPCDALLKKPVLFEQLIAEVGRLLDVRG